MRSLTKTLRLDREEKCGVFNGKKERCTYFADVEAEDANRRRKADILRFSVGVDELTTGVTITCEGEMDDEDPRSWSTCVNRRR